MENVNYFSLRLKEERERLGLSQGEAAENIGVSREMWGKYERGAADPAASKLMQFAGSGADIAYILTGIRSMPIEDTLTRGERATLDHYRHTDAEGQRIIEQTAFFAAECAAKITGKKKA